MAGATERDLDQAAPQAIPSLAEVYRDYADFVVRVAEQLGARPHQAEDVLHDVFVILHRRLPDYDGRSLRSWLYGITRRVVMHHQRRASRAGRREARAPTPVSPPRPEEAVARSEAEAFVDAFLAALPPEQRMVFVLADIEGMSAPEIARATRSKPNTVYSRLRLARSRFQQWVQRHDGGKR